MPIYVLSYRIKGYSHTCDFGVELLRDCFAFIDGKRGFTLLCIDSDFNVLPNGHGFFRLQQVVKCTSNNNFNGNARRSFHEWYNHNGRMHNTVNIAAETTCRQDDSIRSVYSIALLTVP